METEKVAAERKKEIQRLTFRILVALTIVIVAYVIYAFVTKNVNMIAFEIMLGVFVVSYLALTDIVEPYRMGMLKELSGERKAAYGKILLMDLIGAAALLYWIAGMSSEAGNDLLIPVLIYFVTTQVKRKCRGEFEGTESPEDTDTDAEAEEQDGQDDSEE